MTHIELLMALCTEYEAVTKDLLLPVAMQKDDKEPPEPRSPEVWPMRLPDSKAAKKKAPYIINQFITGKDVQPSGETTDCTATVRSIFCTYCENESEGSLHLLNMMERVRIHLLRGGIVGEQFELDREAGLEMLAYPDDTAPYYAGEIVTVWKLPAVEREVTKWLQKETMKL